MPSIESCAKEINSGSATEQTYIDLIKVCFAPQPYLIPCVVGLFECHFKGGKSLQQAFDLAVGRASDILFEGAINRIQESQIDINRSLNNLLANAKASEASYEDERQKIKHGSDRNDAFMKGLYTSCEGAWGQLYKAICQSLPVRFLTEDGGGNTIATVASITSDRCLYYSTTPDAKFCTAGVVLSKVVKLEKV